jgi:hypothetical protein
MDYKKLFREHLVLWRYHAQQKKDIFNLTESAILEIVENSEIIETYPDDTRGSSFLILGFHSNKPYHLVLSVKSDIVFVITIYEPNLDKFENDYKTRKKQ